MENTEMIKRNIIVVASTEERMQGMIRGIESLDTEHEVGIIHGTYGNDAIDEVVLLLADLANALILKEESIPVPEETEVTKGKNIHYIDVPLPKELNDRESIISYMTKYNKGSLVTYILSA